MTGEFAHDRDYDPFERTSSGLLLAEDFARASLDLDDDASAWFRTRGVLDLRTFFPGEDWPTYRDSEPRSDAFHDDRTAIEAQRMRVIWFLHTLAALGEGDEDWDPKAYLVVLVGAGRYLWIDLHERRVRMRIRQPDPEPPPGYEVWVPTDQWQLGWEPLARGGTWAFGEEDVLPLTPDRAGLIELVRRLLEPYVRIAAQFEVEMPWVRPDLPLVVRQSRQWRSILAPIYLQLLEGLRRVTEGQRGAGYCKECREPFLTLDARRSSFCNDQHRFRFSQRERRKRVEAERAARDAMLRRGATNARGGDADATRRGGPR